MDKLTKLAQDHGEVFETLAFFKEALSTSIVDAQKTPRKYIQDLSVFFEQNVVEHFKFEEDGIFPLFFSVGSPEEKDLVRTLQREHIDILEKLDHLKEVIFKSGFPQSVDNETISKLTNLSKEIIEMVLKHARKEDEQLFPLLKKKGFRLEESR